MVALGLGISLLSYGWLALGQIPAAVLTFTWSFKLGCLAVKLSPLKGPPGKTNILSIGLIPEAMVYTIRWGL